MTFDERNTAGRGLFYLFLSQILALLMFIPVLGMIAILAGAVFSILGFYTISKVHDGYKTAFILLLINVAVQLVNGFLAPDGFLGSLFSFASAFINAMIIYFVCNTTSSMLQNLDPAVASLGQKVWKGVMLCTAVEMICIVLAIIPLINVVALIFGGAASIAQVVISILYLVFLWKSQKVLRGN